MCAANSICDGGSNSGRVTADTRNVCRPILQPQSSVTFVWAFSESFESHLDSAMNSAPMHFVLREVPTGHRPGHRPASSSSPRQRLVFAAACILVAVFASMPTLLRLHDHLSTGRANDGFKFSRNIERPHEKHTPIRPVAITTASASEQSLSGEPSATPDAPFSSLWILAAPAPVRAPPAR